MLVSTVTADHQRATARPSFADVSRCRARCRLHHRGPPDAWTLIIHAPVRDGGLDRLLHRVRDVVILQVEEDARSRHPTSFRARARALRW